MPLDASGLLIPDYQQIKEVNKQGILTGTGQPIDFTESSLANTINSVYSAALIDVFELLQSIYDQRDLFKAEGAQLDILASYVGLTRLPASSSDGFISFTAAETTTVSLGSIVKDDIVGNSFLTNRDFSLNSTLCNSIEMQVTGPAETGSLTYTVNIQNPETQLLQTVFYEAFDTEPAANIVAGLVADAVGSLSLGYAEVDAEDATKFTIQYSEDGTQTGTLEVVNTNLLNLFTYSPNIQRNSFTSAIASSSEQTGAVLGTAGTVNTLVTPIANVISVVNERDFTLGQLRESDEDLRQRIISSTSGVSSGTTDSITTSILTNVEDVLSVNTIENTEDFFEDVDGVVLPPHSLMAIVQGGGDDAIAQAIFDRAPAGIRRVGDQTGVATNVIGDNVSIDFQRPEPLYIAVQVDIAPLGDEPYTAEETSIINAIKVAIKTQGDALTIGEEVRPTNFISAVYDAVPSLHYADVTMGYSTTTIDGVDTQAVVAARISGPPQDGEDPHCPINISAIQDANFTLDNIVVVRSLIC